VAGDQQAALFGQVCFNKGEVNNTYGTGGFLMINTDNEYIRSQYNLITTIAVKESGEPCYALEGSVFISGAVIQWLRDELKLLKKASESEETALKLESNDGVYFVPAFVGLGAPYWKAEVRGIITGLTRGTGIDHIIRAGLEAMAYQSYDVLKAMEKDLGTTIQRLQVDGGAAVNNFLLQFQADILDIPVLRPGIIETTSLGVCYMAGLKCGMWKPDDLKNLKEIDREFFPQINEKVREKYLAGWQKAVSQALTGS